MRYLLYIALGSLLLAAPCLAESPAGARELLVAKIDAVMVLLQDKSLAKVDRDAKIIETVAPIFAYPTMAKLSLGKKHWPQLSPEQQTAFETLFIDLLQTSFLDKLSIYSDEKLEYGELQGEGKKVQVPTTLISKDSRIEMLYKFYRTSGGWQVYDVEIGGVSVIQTYRSQFDGVLSTGTIDDLLEKLKSKGDFPLPEAGETKA